MKKFRIAVSIQEILEYPENIEMPEVWGHVETCKLYDAAVDNTFDRVLNLGKEFIKKGLNGNE